MEYKLEMTDYAGGNNETWEEIAVSREEYIGLKHDLAARRGYVMKLPAEATEDLFYKGVEFTPPACLAEVETIPENVPMETPEEDPSTENSYEITMYIGGASDQSVEMTREEFIGVKLYLAKLREAIQLERAAAA